MFDAVFEADELRVIKCALHASSARTRPFQFTAHDQNSRIDLYDTCLPSANLYRGPQPSAAPLRAQPCEPEQIGRERPVEAWNVDLAAKLAGRGISADVVASGDALDLVLPGQGE